MFERDTSFFPPLFSAVGTNVPTEPLIVEALMALLHFVFHAVKLMSVKKGAFLIVFLIHFKSWKLLLFFLRDQYVTSLCVRDNVKENSIQRIR